MEELGGLDWEDLERLLCKRLLNAYWNISFFCCRCSDLHLLSFLYLWVNIIFMFSMFI
jgi:hypothetical protein